MNRFVLVLFLAALGAFAQDASMQCNELDLTPVHADVDFQSDGGCMLTAWVRVEFPSITPKYSRTQRAFNGARCTVARNAVLAAAKLDMRAAGVVIGDGGVP